MDRYAISYAFKKESVTVSYNHQHICFHTFYAGIGRRMMYARFAAILKEKKPQDINRVYALARRYKVSSQTGVAPEGYEGKFG